jgi:hypothetical protein
MIRRVLFLLVAGLSIAAGLVFFVGREGARLREGDVSEAPERRALVPAVPEAPSSLQVRLVLPTASIAAALDHAMPEDHRIAGRQRVCVDAAATVRDQVGARIGGDLGRLLGDLAGEVAREAAGTGTGTLCQDVDYDVTIRKAGPPRAVSTGRSLEITLPIAVEGRAGVPGDLARALGFDSRAFRGGLEAIARVSADLDANWCPRLTATGDFFWTDRAQFEIVDGTWIDIDQPAGFELSRRIEQGIAALDGVVTCAMVRDAVAPEWRETALPLPEAEGLAHLHIRPTGAGFSGIDYGAEAITAAIRIDAVTELRSGPAPAAAAPRDLPPLERIAPSADVVEINLPVRLGYDTLVAELNRQLAGRTFTGRTPAGEARVTVEEVTLYPSGDRLAAGLRFAAGHDSRALSASGWAYLAARPVLDADGRTIRLEDVALTRQVDNELWSLLSGIFNDQIAAQIARNAVFPLDAPIAAAEAQLAAALETLEAETGLRVRLADPDIALTALVPAAEALEAVARFRTRAEVTVLSPP